MLQILTDTQKIALGPLKFTDAKGEPAPVQGVPVWHSSDDTVIALTVAADGLSAVATAGKPGTAQVSVSADADLSDSVATITGTKDFEVQAGQAVSIDIPTGTPTAQ